ncbi:MAG: hypothetical protein LDL26_02140 [Caenispirillum bisanense]|nr:hypothetical protein [Caenispirillum bisanense]
MKRSRGFLEKQRLGYLKSQLESNNPSVVRRSLQDICRLYRAGYAVHPSQAAGTELTVLGVLHKWAGDAGVVRWALLCLAHIGRANCLPVICEVGQKFTNHPEVSAAAIAAMYKLRRNPEEIRSSFDLSDSSIALAALQHVGPARLGFPIPPIKADTASDEELRLALVLVGLDRAPENLFDPKYTNAELVRALGRHDDEIVAQYSIWAVAENENLSLRDVGVNIVDFEGLPPNVRGYLFRLIGASGDEAALHHDILAAAAFDEASEARIGLAIGLSETYFDGLEVITLDWLTAECDEEVRDHLVFHMARTGYKCGAYRKYVLEEYEAAGENSEVRQRLEAGAAGTSLYPELRRLSFAGSDLFRELSVTNNNTFNFNANTNVGALSASGSARNSGGATFIEQSGVEEIRAKLLAARDELRQLEVSEELRVGAVAAIDNASADPSLEKIQAAVDWLQRIDTILAASARAAGSVGAIAGHVAKVAGLV